MEINDDTLALDLIDEVGPDGNFLDTDHTLSRFRSRWYPTLIERDDYASWLKKGGKGLGQRASARVDHILAEHRPEPLPEKVRDQLMKITHRATEGGTSIA